MIKTQAVNLAEHLLSLINLSAFVNSVETLSVKLVWLSLDLFTLVLIILPYINNNLLKEIVSYIAITKEDQVASLLRLSIVPRYYIINQNHNLRQIQGASKKLMLVRSVIESSTCVSLLKIHAK